MEENSVDSIMAVLEKWAAEKRPIDPATYLEAAMKLAALVGNEADTLFDMEQKVAKMRVELLQNGMTAAATKMHIEATDEYKLARKQRAKIDRVQENIRLAKARSRLASDEMRNQ